MCFSATASFVTAGITGAVGIAALSWANQSREWPLAATPLLFALHQSIEGLLWLAIPLTPGGTISSSLTFMFLFLAEAFWPVYAPVAVLLIEPNRGRRRLMLMCLAVGAGVSVYLLHGLLGRDQGAAILDGHIVYLTDYRHSDAVGLAYLAATGLPLLLSSHRTVLGLGAIVLVGSTIAYAFYWEAFVSVWCFFAAVASLTILCHFELSRRRRLKLASA
jgi:hypothetical protein